MRGVGNTVVAVDNRVAGVDKRVAKVDDMVAGVNDRVAGVDSRVSCVNTNALNLSLMRYLNPELFRWKGNKDGYSTNCHVSVPLDLIRHVEWSEWIANATLIRASQSPRAGINNGVTG